jgi:hypothetical protein
MDTFAVEAELEAALKRGLDSEFSSSSRTSKLNQAAGAAGGHQPSGSESTSSGGGGGREIAWDEDLEHLLMPALHAYEYVSALEKSSEPCQQNC